jgi:predicted phage tail component-like protein
MPYIPQKRQTIVEVKGRDGQYVFEDGYNNIQITLACAVPGYNILDRRKKAREIAAWLSGTGELIFDYEKDVAYKVVKITNDISANMLSREYKDEFTVTFECKPYQQQTFYNDNLAWENADVAWEYANIPWEGYDRTFLVTDGQTIDVVNAGTYKALPIIILTGVAETITVSGFKVTKQPGIVLDGEFTFTNLNGTIYIDCEEKLVYSQSGNTKTNKITDFSGEFPELFPETNSFVVNGTITNLTIAFDYKNTYL